MANGERPDWIVERNRLGPIQRGMSIADIAATLDETQPPYRSLPSADGGFKVGFRGSRVLAWYSASEELIDAEVTPKTCRPIYRGISLWGSLAAVTKKLNAIGVEVVDEGCEVYRLPADDVSLWVPEGKKSVHSAGVRFASGE